MATAIPALSGKFGSYEYWLTTMRVGEIIRSITIPKDDPDWPGLSIEERYQRDVNLRRVKKDIAPYFAGDPDRFSGALILAVKNHEGMSFEPLSSIGPGKMPKLYLSAAENIGFLTLSGREVLVPLDGQHRAKAFEFAISGNDEADKAIPNVRPNSKLAEEEVAVILVRFESEKSRRIFNKVNRYAKPTTKADNLITDDDDAVAVATRLLIGGEGEGGIDGHLMPARLVRFQSNTLNAKAPEFTTLATFYEANLVIVKECVWAGLPGTPQGADEKQRELFQEKIRELWQTLLDRIELFAQAVQDPTADGDARRMDIREASLLGKPIGQLVLVRAFLELKARLHKSDAELCNRLNRVDWSVSWPGWTSVLMNPNGRVMSGRTTVNTATLFTARLCGAALSEDEESGLRSKIAGDDPSYKFPKPVA